MLRDRALRTQSGGMKAMLYEVRCFWNQMKIWSSHLLDNLSNCLMNLKNSGDSTGFEPMTSTIPVQYSNQLSYEVTLLSIAHSAFGLMGYWLIAHSGSRVFTKSVDSNFRAFWLAPVTRNILGYSLFCERKEKWRVVSRKFQKKKLKQHFFIHLIW